VIWYEPVDKPHYQFLYDLLEERPQEACISHKKMPTWSEHCAFVDSFPYKEWWIIMDGSDRAGSVYLTHQNEFGMFIKNGYHGRGIATHTFKWVRERYKGERLLSNVNPANKRIIAVLTRLGCRKVQETYEHSAE
jgi:RimJ/RimL family protein N-acetyltransferase